MEQQIVLTRGLKVIVGFHIFSFSIWVLGQTGALIAYDTVAEWGLQEPRALVDPVIVEVNRAIALTDTIIMIPLFLVAATGLVRMKYFGIVTSWLVFGMTLYWPLVFWFSQLFYAKAAVMHMPISTGVVILPAALWIIAAWGSWYLYKNRKLFE